MLGLILLALLTQVGAHRSLALAPDEPSSPGKLAESRSEDLSQLVKNEEFMTGVLRDIQQLRRLQDVAPKFFLKYFSPDHSRNILLKHAGTSTAKVGVTLATGGLGHELAEAAHLGLTAFESAELGLHAAHAGHGHGAVAAAMATPEKMKNVHLAATSIFPDLDLGTLWTAYAKVKLAASNNGQVTWTVARPTTLIRHSKSVCELPAGTIVQTFGGAQRSKRKVTCVCPGAADTSDGELPSSALLHRGWYVYNGDQELPILSRNYVLAQNSVLAHQYKKTFELLRKGDIFTVTKKMHDDKFEKWKLGDGRGWIMLNSEDVAAMEGPLENMDTAIEAKQPGQVTDSISQAASNWLEKPPFLIGRLALLGGCALGGFFTGGATWVALPAISISSEVASLALRAGQTLGSLEKIAFNLVGAAQL